MSEAFILDAMPQEALAAFGSTFALQVRSAISHVSSWDNVTNLGTFERNRIRKHVENWGMRLKDWMTNLLGDKATRVISKTRGGSFRWHLGKFTLSMGFLMLSCRLSIITLVRVVAQICLGGQYLTPTRPHMGILMTSYNIVLQGFMVQNLRWWGARRWFETFGTLSFALGE